ncbi:FAD-dependent oxidoreductase [Corallococcus exiguus]|uniref:FAD-dependent oxidoreductase n=1 Tax=Corallococcus exiguus TaxID=83462 RepID=UPI001494056B|nr:FAD/NAD(P)-binding protein [Corallococcus exiguus]NPD27197.1 FAD-dependent oxidoreductase [Corallococcus exiguus]
MPSVIVVGGGVAGLTVAHELVERGFEVQVFDTRTAWGGKARSQPVAGTGTNGRRDLPASTASASTHASTATSST